MKDVGRVDFDVCHRCDQIVLKGVEKGIQFYLSSLTVPLPDARLLHRWGLPLFVVRRYNDHLYYGDWSGGKTDWWVVLEHECTRDYLNWHYRFKEEKWKKA